MRLVNKASIAVFVMVLAVIVGASGLVSHATEYRQNYSDYQRIVTVSASLLLLVLVSILAWLVSAIASRKHIVQVAILVISLVLYVAFLFCLWQWLLASTS